ncbi:MAG: RNA polymerase subunit sigma-24, partial [Cellulomonas sp.]|nr:RNA polymerase subunit sigma-24 [Cellulomonas sp.]
MRSWEDVLDDLVRHRGGALVRYATLLTGDRRAAEDLVQDALVKAFGTGRPLRDALAAEAYVRRAILTVFLDGIRRRRRWSGVAHLLVLDDE